MSGQSIWLAASAQSCCGLLFGLSTRRPCRWPISSSAGQCRVINTSQFEFPYSSHLHPLLKRKLYNVLSKLHHHVFLLLHFGTGFTVTHSGTPGTAPLASQCRVLEIYALTPFSPPPPSTLLRPLSRPPVNFPSNNSPTLHPLGYRRPLPNPQLFPHQPPLPLSPCRRHCSQLHAMRKRLPALCLRWPLRSDVWNSHLLS